MPAGAVSPVAPPDGHRALADRQPAVLLSGLLNRHVVFFGGKGGVGKTTCSSAFALAASRQRQRVLLVSTDPAHSTSDIFEQKIGGKVRELQPGLSALEIDSEAEATRYINDVKRDIQRMFSPAIIQQAHRQIELAAASPGLLEVALLDRMIDLIVDAERTYDLIVFDTAPTGHTLQLLRMPDAMTAWIGAGAPSPGGRRIDRGTDQTQEQAEAADPVLAALAAATSGWRGCARRSWTIRARDDPERLAIEETRAAELLDDTGRVAAIVNRVLPTTWKGVLPVAQAQEGDVSGEIDRFKPAAGSRATVPRTGWLARGGGEQLLS